MNCIVVLSVSSRGQTLDRSCLLPVMSPSALTSLQLISYVYVCGNNQIHFSEFTVSFVL